MGKQQQYPAWKTGSADLEERLADMEAEFSRTLKENGYPVDPYDPDVLGQERHWRKLQPDISASRTPYDSGDRARRALAGLLLVRHLREALATEDINRAVRYALNLGALEGDVLTHALAIITNRARGFRQGNLSRRHAKEQRHAEVRRLAKKIQSEREHSDLEQLSRTALAARIHHKGSPAIKKLSVRTIRDYLSS